jgi:carbamoyltransferase
VYILGIVGGFHDAAAALIQDGRVVALVEEERFTRVKHAFGQFPHHAVKFCLDRGKVGFADLDYVTYYHNLPHLIRSTQKIKPYRQNFKRHPEKKEQFIKYFTGIDNYLRDWCRENKLKLKVISHHDCHLASAFFGSRFKESNILSVDCRGEDVSTVMAVGRGSTIKYVGEIRLPHSLGMLYTLITGFLGYRMFHGEGKVMGLASYGEDRYKGEFAKIISPTRKGFETDYRYIWNSFTDGFLVSENILEKVFGKARPYRNDPRNGTDEHIAASLQKKTEQIVIHLVELMYQKTGLKNLCLAGGVALNAKLNGELLKRLEVEHLYVQPLSNDAGCALGGPYWLYNQLTSKRPDPIDHVYFGPDYSQEQIKTALANQKVKFSSPDNIADRCAELLSSDNVVGWFQGNMEAGPRALGNRSILGNPANPNMKDTINEKVKHREPWRPFAPSILASYEGRYLVKPNEAPFMIVCFDTKKEALPQLSSAVHIDNTSRAQIVSGQSNPLFAELISSFGKLTGIYAVLNTSFNVRGQPIVNTPEEAIEVFLSTGMDYLAIGDYLAEK